MPTRTNNTIEIADVASDSFKAVTAKSPERFSNISPPCTAFTIKATTGKPINRTYKMPAPPPRITPVDARLRINSLSYALRWRQDLRASLQGRLGRYRCQSPGAAQIRGTA